MNVIEGRFDRRAIHRVIADPPALDILNDATALTQRAIAHLEAANWIALGYADADLLKGINVAHECLTEIRALSRSAAGLLEQSVPVEPYLAVEYAALEVA